MAHVKRAIRSNPDFPLAYRWLAASLGQLGQAGEAKEALETAIAIAPAHSACMSTACRGTGRMSMLIWSQACVERDGKAELGLVHLAGQGDDDVGGGGSPL